MQRAQDPTLLLIHGFPLDGTLWDPQRADLIDVAKVLAPDLRGFGNDRREVPGVMSMDAFAQDIKDQLDEAAIDRVILCGLSMGGYVAFSFLQRCPERVQALVLCNTKASADDADAKAGRKSMARDANEKGMAVIARAMVAKVLSETSRREQPQLVARIEAMIARQRPDAVAAASLGMAQRADRTAMLPTIAVPTLVITGSSDELMPLPTSRTMADNIPGARLEVIKGAGHLSNVEAPEAFNTLLRTFLQEVIGGNT